MLLEKRENKYKKMLKVWEAGGRAIVLLTCDWVLSLLSLNNRFPSVAPDLPNQGSTGNVFKKDPWVFHLSPNPYSL